MRQSDKNYDIEENAGDYTKSILDSKIYSFDSENIEEILRDTEEFRSFGENLKLFIKNIGYDGPDDNGSIKKFIISSFDKNGMNDAVSAKTLDRWLKGEVQPDFNSRESIFMLMFALNADLEQTISFFTKAYYSQPFNFRKSSECIYYWCLKNNSSWSEASRLKELLKSKESTSDSFDGHTYIIGQRLDELNDENELIAYITNNICDDEVYFRTAREIFSDLLEEAKEIASTQKTETDYTDKRDSFSYRRQTGSKDYLLSVIFDSHEPVKPDKSWNRVIRENFPSKVQFSRCMNEEAENADILRKAIILLAFYITFENNEGDFDSFCNSADFILENCGFPLLYPANPYDRIFLTCAFSAAEGQTLDCFRNAFCDESE